MVDIPGLYDKLPEELKESLFRPIMENLDVRLVCENVKIDRDREGEKATFKVHFPENPKVFYLVTRANQPLRVARWLMETKGLPVMIAFTMKGKAIFVVDPSDITQATTGDQIPF